MYLITSVLMPSVCSGYGVPSSEDELQSISNPQKQFEKAVELASFYQRESQKDSALHYYNLAYQLSKHEALKGQTRINKVLGNVVYQLYTLKAYPLAIAVGERCINALNDDDNLNDKANVFKYTGLSIKKELVNAHQPDAVYQEKAIRYYNEALKLFDMAGNEVALNKMLYNSFILYSALQKPDLAEAYMQRSIELSKTLEDNSVLAKRYMNYGLFLWDNEREDEGILFLAESTSLYEDMHDYSSLGILMNDLAVRYINSGYYLTALSHLNRANSLKSQFDPARKGFVYYNLGITYESLEQYDSALHYYEASMSYIDHKDVDINVLEIWLGIGNSYSHLIEQEPAFADSAIHYFERIIATSKSPVFCAAANIGLGTAEYHLAKYQAAISHCNKGLGIIDTLSKSAIGNYGYTIYTAKNTLGNVYFDLGQTQAAINHFVENLALTEADNNLQFMQLTMVGLKDVYVSLGDYKNAFKYSSSHDSIQSIIEAEELQLQLKETQHSYNINYFEKLHQIKEDKIALANNQKAAELRSIILLLTSALVAFMSLAMIVWYRQRLKASRQMADHMIDAQNKQIDSILKHQESNSIQAMIQGQEAERKRIAKDLHDRLGSMLSTVKLYFTSLEAGFTKASQDDETTYHKAVTLLDNACEEVRKISHNMATGVLTRFGLSAAIKELCETISESKQIKVNYVAYELDQRFDNELEINIYRIVQEAASNVLKHAKAKELTIQFTQYPEHLNIMIEDNGIGFLPDAIETESMGIKNMKARIEQMKGGINIDSTPGRGTTVTIDIPVKYNKTIETPAVVQHS